MMALVVRLLLTLPQLSAAPADDGRYGVHRYDRGAPQLLPPPATRAMMGLNAQDFGAVGDGAHDDTAAMQSAVDEAHTRVWPVGL